MERRFRWVLLVVLLVVASAGLVSVAQAQTGQTIRPHRGVRADFDYDRRSDMLWRHSSGWVGSWLLDGTVRDSALLANISLSWRVAGTADLDGDGPADILWRHWSGAVASWTMNGLTVIDSQGIGVVHPNWSIIGLADVNGDHRSDVLWRHVGGAFGIWLMDGATVVTTAVFLIPPSWELVAYNDLDDDGIEDLVWRHTSGAVVGWLMDFPSITQVAYPHVSLSWKLAATGDYNYDGRADLLWRHSSGLIGIWLMDGTEVLASGIFAKVSPLWQIAGSGDYDGNGVDDVVWRYINGNTVLWMTTYEARTITWSGQFLAALSTSWQLVTHGELPSGQPRAAQAASPAVAEDPTTTFMGDTSFASMTHTLRLDAPGATTNQASQFAEPLPGPQLGQVTNQAIEGLSPTTQLVLTRAELVGAAGRFSAEQLPLPIAMPQQGDGTTLPLPGSPANGTTGTPDQ